MSTHPVLMEGAYVLENGPDILSQRSALLETRGEGDEVGTVLCSGHVGCRTDETG